jgi:hypothetical protein
VQEEEDTVSSSPPPPIVTVASSADPMQIVAILMSQLTELERRIGGKIDTNAQSALKRWDHHAIEHSTLSDAVGELKRQFDDHVRVEREEDLIHDARLAPMKRLALLAAREWRTIAIALLFTFEFIQRNT